MSRPEARVEPIVTEVPTDRAGWVAMLVALEVPEGLAGAIYDGIQATPLPAGGAERLALGREFIDLAVGP